MISCAIIGAAVLASFQNPSPELEYQPRAIWPELPQPAYFDTLMKIVEGPGGAIFMADLRKHAIWRIDSDGAVSSAPSPVRWPSSLAFTADGVGILHSESYARPYVFGPEMDAFAEVLIGLGNSPFAAEPFGSRHPVAIAAAPESVHIYRVLAMDAHRKFALPDWNVQSAFSIGLPDSLYDDPESPVPDYQEGVGLMSRWDIAADENRVFWTDVSNDVVRLRSSQGSVVWGESGNDPGQLSLPSGLGLAADGLLFVADAGNHRIQVFNDEGEAVSHWGAQGLEDGLLYDPTSVAAASDHTVYVVDNARRRLQRFDRGGEWIESWRSFGAAPGEFDLPMAIAASPNGDIWIYETGNRRIQRLSASGAPSGDIPLAAEALFPNTSPVALACDSQGRLHVLVCSDATIRLYGTKGEFLDERSVPHPDERCKPLAIAFDGTDRLYVGYTAAANIGLYAVRYWDSQDIDGSDFVEPQYHGAARIALAVGPDESLYIVEGGASVRRFSREGGLLESFGYPDGFFSVVTGIAVANDHALLFAVRGNDEITRYTPERTGFFRNWGENLPGGRFDGPQAVAVDATGVIYIVDTRHNRIVLLGKPDEAANPADINGDDTVDAIDVQLVINAALGIGLDGLDGDVNGDNDVNAIDVQLVVNAALGL